MTVVDLPPSSLVLGTTPRYTGLQPRPSIRAGTWRRFAHRVRLRVSPTMQTPAGACCSRRGSAPLAVRPTDLAATSGGQQASTASSSMARAGTRERVLSDPSTADRSAAGGGFLQAGRDTTATPKKLLAEVRRTTTTA